MNTGQKEVNPTIHSNKNYWWLPGIVLLAIMVGIFYYVHNQNEKNERPFVPDANFAGYVTGYTGGSVSKRSPIMVRLARAPKKQVKQGDFFDKSWLQFIPSIKGEAVWKDDRTIAFYPKEDMESGKVYKARLSLDKVMEVEEKQFREFNFGFQVIPQSIELEKVHLVATNDKGLSEYSLKGRLLTADEANKELVEKCLQANWNGKKVAIDWNHESATVHGFTIKGLTREEKMGEVQLSWSGSPLGISQKGKKEFQIPSKGTFAFLEARADFDKKQLVRLYFSDPIEPQQDLTGLIRTDQGVEFDYVINNNEITLYPKSPLSGQQEISISREIKNTKGKILFSEKHISVEFEENKPAIRFVKRGNILPSTDGMVLPFEAIGLKSVLVRVIKIDQERTGQFFQVNELEGSSQLNRVGRPVLQKVISLESLKSTDLKKWNRFTLELSKLIEAEKGAIYQVTLAFSRADLLASCELDEPRTNLEGLKMVDNPREKIDYSDFEDGDAYYYSGAFEEYYDSDYDWSERENPCNSAYYSGNNNLIKTNLLATDVGLIAKRGAKNNLQVIVTDLTTAEPMSEAAVYVYNYQLQKIATTHTNKDGIADLYLDQKPFLVEAVNQGQWAYLKVNDNNELSVSQFDVSGQKIQQGIKGFIYGDRGVWRPGDSLYLTFMLEDRMGRLPESYPVIFELTNPRGIMVERRVNSSSVKGLYSFKTATSPDDPTGNWSAKIKVGDAEFFKTLPIETVKPNRLKIDLSFPNQLITPEQQSGELKARWLTGAIGSGLKAQFEMILTAEKTAIKGFNDYSFDNPASGFFPDERVVFDGYLDGQGQTDFNPGINFAETGGHLPGHLKAHFTGKVFEPGGNFSVHYQTVNVRPYSVYIGLKAPKGTGYGEALDLGKSHTFQVAAVDSSGRARGNRALNVSVYKTEWRWWWDVNEGGNADYVNSEDYKKVIETKVTTQNGKGEFKVKIDEPNWGRYFVVVEDVATGYTAGQFVYFDWAYGSDRSEAPGGATRLSFSTDKGNYQPGEKIKVLIPGSGTGRVLISVENGSKVLSTYWFAEKSGNGEYAIPVTKEMTPNVFINVSLLQPHGQTVNDLPIRQYGIVGVKVEDPKTRLHPVLGMAPKLSPNKKVEIKVSEKDGKAMAYTVALVDEGLLDLTNFKTPDPHAAFYAREALGVKSFDLFDQVIGAYGGQLERLLSIGGDGAIENKVNNKNVRFKPVVKFFGPYYLKKGATATHSFVMPEYVGSVRTMLIAGNEGAYGEAEETTPVTQPLMILPTLPRVGGPGEQISIPVNVFAIEKGVKQVTVSVEDDEYFKVLGPSSKQVNFSEPGNTVVFFDVKVAEKEGYGQIKVNASGGGFKTSVTTDLQVRHPNPPQTRVLTTTIEPGASWSPELDFFGIKGSNTATLEVATVQPLNLEKRLGYLTGYPYGCLEQRVSTAFPQLYLSQLSSLTEGQKDSIAQHVNAVLREMTHFQHRSGGFSYWPGSNYTDDWVSNYAGHFMIEAQKAGYQIVPGLWDQWIQFQNNRANSWKAQKNHRDELVQAYRLYTLALAKQPNWSAMNRLYNQEGLSLRAKWRLAGAYAVSGKLEAAKELIQNVAPEVEGDYRELSYTYGSTLRDQAMLLQSLTELGQQKSAYRLVQKITERLNSKSWLSTQETSFSLLAMAQYYKNEKVPSSLQFDYAEKGGKGQSVKEDKAIWIKKLSLQKNGDRLKVTNRSNGTIYATVMIKGVPPVGSEEAHASRLSLEVQYKNAKNQPLQLNQLKQGEDFIAEVTVTNPGLDEEYSNLALSQIFPSGWEIRNTRFDGTEGYRNDGQFDYQDIRDDRVYTFFSLGPSKKKTIRIRLNATYAGRFYLPGLSCSAMYDASISASNKGQWIEIKPELPQP